MKFKWYTLLLLAALVLSGRADDDDDDDDDDDRRPRRPKRPRRPTRPKRPSETSIPQDYCTVTDKQNNNQWIDVSCNRPYLSGEYQCEKKVEPQNNNSVGYTTCPLFKIQCYHGTCKGFNCVCTVGWVDRNCNSSCPKECAKNCALVNEKAICVQKCPVNATHNITGPNCTIAVPISPTFTTCQFSGVHCYHGTCASDGLFCECTPGAGFVGVNCNTPCPAQCPKDCSFINQQATCTRICPLNSTHRATGRHCEIVVRIGQTCPSNATHRFTGDNCETAEPICPVCPVCPTMRPGSTKSGVVCDKGWKEFHNKCYKFAKCNGCTPETSKSACEQIDAIQAKITSLEHHRFIVANKPGQQVSVGAHWKNRVWRWEDGTRVKYFKWHRGEPNRVGREKCMLLGWRHYQDDNWVDIGCDAKVNGYVCEKEKLCDKGWKEFHNKCYKFSKCNGCTPETSKSACEQIDAIQAKITSLEHHRFIVANKPGQQVSVGAHWKNRVWRWEDGTRVKYFKWHRGEPNRVGREKCMLLGWRHYQDDNWVDIGCDAKVNGYVCEKEKSMNYGQRHNDQNDEEFVGFSVGRSSGYRKHASRIPMSVVIYNQGGYFHMSDNCFHAPYDGVYSFSFSVVADRGRWADVILYRQKKGQAKVGLARSIDRGINKRMGAAGATAMVELEEGETVYLWLVGYGLKACGEGKPPCTVFSGKMEKRLYN